MASRGEAFAGMVKKLFAQPTLSVGGAVLTWIGKTLKISEEAGAHYLPARQLAQCSILVSGEGAVSIVVLCVGGPKTVSINGASDSLEKIVAFIEKGCMDAFYGSESESE